MLKVITASPRIWAVSDHFLILNGQEIYQQATDDRGEWHTTKADRSQLRLLTNDVVFNLPDKYKTCVMKTRHTPEENTKYSTDWFEDVREVG